MNTDVLSTLTGTSVNDISKVIKQGWQNTRPFMTGCLLYTKNAFSICGGIVLDVGVDDKNNLYSVSVEYDYQTWVRYCMLQTCNVSVGDKVKKDDKIGTTYKNVLRFEYCTDEFSVFPYRCGNRQLYKHDPMVVLSGSVSLPEIDDPGNVIITDEVMPDEVFVNVEEE